MTNFERIKVMTIEEMAKHNIRETIESDIDYDWEENAIESTRSVLMTSDENTFFCYELALEHEIEWLNRKVGRK